MNSTNLHRSSLRFGVGRLALVALLASLPSVACSGGGAVASASQPSCDPSGGGQALCLVSCNLGCSAIGCAVTDISQNQPIILAFSQDLDATSVNTSSFSLRTAAGKEPVGQYLTNGSTVTFVPEIQVVGGASFFGFEANETYTLTLPGGASEINALRSTGGDVVAETVTCNLRVTRGVIDLDGKPPSSKMVSPVSAVNVDPRTTIVVEFSEIIDVTPFLQASFGSEPIRVLVSKSLQGSSGALECDPGSRPVQVRGTWNIGNDVVRQVSTATFTAAQSIPGGVCVRVSVNSSVRDLSGKPAAAQVFEYLTSGTTKGPVTLREAFADDVHFDAINSAGDWVGGLRPGSLGWDGFHGLFTPSIGRSLGNGVFEISTDNQVIPRNRTLSGEDETVTDGVFRFSSFLVPSGTTVRFIGENPVRLYVRGHAQVDGTLDLQGASLSEHDGNSSTGQPGGSGGAGAGDGGVGGDMGDGIAHRARFSGQDGEDLMLPAGTAYGGAGSGGTGAHPNRAGLVSSTIRSAAGGMLRIRPQNTGGKGSSQFPGDGSEASIVEGWSPFSVQVAAGGGGGGFIEAGGVGLALKTGPPDEPSRTEDLGPPALGGSRLDPRLLPAGRSVLDHYLIGGSGGGGAGSHPFLWSNFVSGRIWRSGGGGGGGGGAIGGRIGRSFLVGPGGLILANGGSTLASADNNYGVPGGGGSGGSIVLQVASPPIQDGLLDVSGGIGGTVSGGFVPMCAKGGDGSPGYIRIEVPGMPPSDPTEWAGTISPAGAAELASLTEEDLVTGIQSLWYRTGQVFPPEFDRYEIDATIDGGDVTFSDDGATGHVLADGAVRFLVQGANENELLQVDPATVSPWRRFVGPFAPPGERALTDDGVTVVRFLVLFDRRLADQIVIREVRLTYRPL